MARVGVAELPLHGGKAPRWLFTRMVDLAEAILTVTVDEIGARDTLRRFSDPFWFQAFSCVLGFDWHSSGTTTVTCGAVKEALQSVDLGLSSVGGKGAASRKVGAEIESICEERSIPHDLERRVLRASRLSAKVDSSALQDGHQLYHHSLLFDSSGNWSVVQQGMNEASGFARRYHWSSDELSSFCEEPHSSIIGERMDRVLDLTSRSSSESRKVCCELASEDPRRTSEVVRAASRGPQSSILEWTPQGESIPSVLQMPKRINWKVLRSCYEIQPKGFEELLCVEGVGPSTVRALAYAAEIIYGKESSWRDPVKFSFAVGGKDGVPYPVDRRAMDRTIQILRQGTEEARVGNRERLAAVERLRRFVPPDIDWK
ncbi:DUF763 domain-containing protein [Candidatus Bathyarchaeota archaeon]|nr:DUF763 domain-containing protein [Candidatus Bathyarchaeota archaeon]